MNRPVPASKSPHYHAYLVRLWRDSPTTEWHASLEWPSTGERRGFADVASLCAFLVALTKDEAPDVKPP